MKVCGQIRQTFPFLCTFLCLKIIIFWSLLAFRTLCLHIQVDNFIHADMHPGNILVREAQKKPSRKHFFKSKPHVIFLDVGMTAELSKNDRTNLLEFFKAVACRDGRTAAECTLRLSKRQNCPNPEAFIQVTTWLHILWKLDAFVEGSTALLMHSD